MQSRDESNDLMKTFKNRKKREMRERKRGGGVFLSSCSCVIKFQK